MEPYPIQNLNILSKKEGMREEFSKRTLWMGERGEAQYIPNHFREEKYLGSPPEKFPLLCLVEEA